MTYDIAIIGAGIIGAACAYRLSQEGLRVIIIEANETAGGTTATGMGHIVVMDDSIAQFELTNYSQKLWKKLSNILPTNCEYQNSGTIWIASNDAEMEAIYRKKDLYNSRNVKAEILNNKSLIKTEPNLQKNLVGGLLVKADSVVYQLSATRFLLDKALKNGIQLSVSKKVINVLENTLELENGETVHAKRIINAAGFWSNDLTKDLKIIKRKGHLIITEKYPKFVKHQLVELGYLKSAHSNNEDSVAFNIQPRITEQVLIGSSRQFEVEDKAIDYEIVKQMMRRAFKYMPSLKKLTANRIWTGFRPSTPDNLPYIGQHPKIENLYLATGHEGLGITTSLATAEILTDEILGFESAIDRKPYSPKRFH